MAPRIACGAGRPQPLLASFDDGRRALLPVSLELAASGEVRRALSSPAGTYGGWIAGEPLGTDHAEVLAALLRTRWPGLAWRANPFDAAQVAAAGDGTPDATLTLEGDFGDAPFEIAAQNGETWLTLAEAGAVGLSAADDRFITTSAASGSRRVTSARCPESIRVSTMLAT